MTNLSRRTALAGALSALATSATAEPRSAAIPLHGDAELLALQDQIDAADRAHEEAIDAADAAFTEFVRRKPPEPEKTPGVFPAELDARLQAVFAEIRALPHNKEAADRRKEWELECEHLEEECGVEATRAQQDVAISAVSALRDRIATERATSWAGLAFKARYAASHYPADPESEVAISIIEDILAMTGRDDSLVALLGECRARRRRWREAEAELPEVES